MAKAKSAPPTLSPESKGVLLALHAALGEALGLGAAEAATDKPAAAGQTDLDALMGGTPAETEKPVTKGKPAPAADFDMDALMGATPPPPVIVKGGPTSADLARAVGALNAKDKAKAATLIAGLAAKFSVKSLKDIPEEALKDIVPAIDKMTAAI